MNPQPELVPVLDLLGPLRTTKPTIYKLIREEQHPFVDGVLPIVRIGRMMYVRSTQLARFLAGEDHVDTPTEDVA